MAKAKLSVSVNESVVRRLDKAAKNRSRSEVVEAALLSWLRNQRRRDLEAAIERYYAEITQEDREEDAEWARLGLQSASKVWS